ncbi:MAG: hypothetical protein N2114_05945, partial [Candidatus Goldbacteria bacterium]|nr:hypothetical protein [Candidatus Goldiibacteriota bacterium]
MIKKIIIGMFFLILNSFFVFAVEQSFIIPQKDIIYSDLKTLAEAGIITSTSKEYFENNAITRLEAAGYIIEAKNN